MSPRWALLMFVAVAAEYFAAGLFAWGRRPSNGTGALLCLCGFSLFAAAGGNTGVPALLTVAALAAELPLAVIFHLLLAFPSGRLQHPMSRRLVVAGYAVSVVLHALRLALAANPALPAWMRVHARPGLAAFGQWTQVLAGATVITLSVWVLLRRLRRASPRARRGLAFVYIYGGSTFVFLILSANVLRPLLGFGPVALFEMQVIAFAGTPIAFLVGVLRGGFARTRELDELAAWLGSADDDRPRLREALRGTLGDPSLDLLFWLADREEYVDEAGHPVTLPVPGSGRAAVEVTAASGRIGAIAYDATLIADATLVRTAGRVIAIALERERLTAELHASREALRVSRSRIVESADRERRRIARDLHDGLQGRLVLLALRAGQLASRIGETPLAPEVLALRSDLEASIAELRRLVHGVLPTLLLERGLPAAVEELLDQTPIRSQLCVPDSERRAPPHVETAGYFVVAEALANAVKHAQASSVSVRLGRAASSLRIEVRDDGVGGAALDSGSGLRGLCDRVEAIGGRLQLDSDPGRGTCVLAELPCAS